MSFNDIFKSSYLENVSAIDIPDMIIALVLAFLVGLCRSVWSVLFPSSVSVQRSKSRWI